MRLRFIANVQSIAKSKIVPSSTVFSYRNVPVYIWFDTNTILSTTPSVNEIIQYENLKIKSLVRRWTYYTKFRRNIPINTSLTTQVSTGARGYLATSSPVTTQTVGVYIYQLLEI
jgi:hypothetical protein